MALHLDTYVLSLISGSICKLFEKIRYSGRRNRRLAGDSRVAQKVTITAFTTYIQGFTNPNVE